MKRFLVYIMFFVFAVFSFAENKIGIIEDYELIKVGVKKENLEKAKIIISKVGHNYKKLTLEKRKIEMQINDYFLEDPDKNLKKMEALCDRIGEIDATIMKDKIRHQVELRKYITQEQYIKAREAAIKRIINENK